MRKLGTLLLLSLFLVAANYTTSTATPPDPNVYDTSEILFTSETAVGGIALRRGYWDPDETNRYTGKPGEGFGYDKAYHKHGVTDINLIAWIFAPNNFSIDAVGDATGATDDIFANHDDGVNFYREVEGVNCDLVYNGVEICGEYMRFDMIGAANLEEKAVYYDAPAGNPTSAEEAERRVGVQTVYCDGFDAAWDYKCPSFVNSFLDDHFA